MNDRFLAELRGEVLAAAEREEVHRRRRRTRRTALRVLSAAAVVVLVVAVVLVARPEVAQAGVEIVRDGDELVVSLTEGEVLAEEIADAATEAGLDVVVEAVPVGPSNVGRFIRSGGDLPEGFRVAEGDPASSFESFRIPADFDGRLLLFLGREARPGEEWLIGSQATAKGEVLECEVIVGERLDAVLGKLPAGVEVQVLVVDNGQVVDVDESEPYAATRVVRANSRGPRDVWLEVSEDPGSFPGVVEPEEEC